MWFIVGLGNPGKKFERTRHNAGYMVVDELAARNKIVFKPGKGNFFFANSDKFMLFKPTTYMNNSGKAVKQIVSLFCPDLSGLLVVYDDIDLDLGRIRLRPSGSAGGHKGMESILYHLESEQFPRLRFGIGPQPVNVPSENWVLSEFTKKEIPLLNSTISLASGCINDLIENSLEYAMNMYNRKPDFSLSES